MKNFIRIVLVIIILITGTYAYFDYTQELNDNVVYEDADDYIIDTEDYANPEDEVNFDQYDNILEAIAKYQMNYDWKELHVVNDDIVGWLYIPGNDIINFPVVQGTNNNFYLNHDYTTKYNSNGAAFVDYRYDKFCLNKIIYGHNMSLSSTKPAFTTLINWKDKEYFDSHRELYYTEANGMTKKYLIVAIAGFNVASDDGYSYLDMKFENEEEFRGWVEYIKEHSTYFDLGDNTIDYRADEVICLSTCDRHAGWGGQGRSVLFCINLTNNELDKNIT